MISVQFKELNVDCFPIWVETPEQPLWFYYTLHPYKIFRWQNIQLHFSNMRAAE